jgi:hypothetical protein
LIFLDQTTQVNYSHLIFRQGRKEENIGQSCPKTEIIYRETKGILSEGIFELVKLG